MVGGVALHDRRHAARGRRAERRHRRDALDARARTKGARGQNAPRNGAGRGVAYWASADGADRRIIYVTPGYRMIALDAKTGMPVPAFGKNGVVDLKLDDDQELDLDTAELGLNATPLVVGDVIVVGAAHRAGGAPRTMHNARGYVRGFDVRTGKRLWIFHTIPQRGEFGYDTWLENGAERNGNTGVWAQMSADPELGLVYVPVEMPTGDYYGGNRPGNTLFAESLRRARRQDRHAASGTTRPSHHGVWDYDLPCAPILFDMADERAARSRRWRSRPSRRSCSCSIARPASRSGRSRSGRCRSRRAGGADAARRSRFRPSRCRSIARASSTDDLIDFTPELRAEALEVVKRYKIGPLFTPPVAEHA